MLNAIRLIIGSCKKRRVSLQHRLQFGKASKSILIVSVLLLGAFATIVPHASGAATTSYQQSGTLTLAMPNCIDSFAQFTTECDQPWYFIQTMFPDDGVPTATGIDSVAVNSYYSSSNGTIWYFHLTPGMTWSDGVPVNSTDLTWSIQQMFSSYSWGAGSLAGYASLLAGTPQQAVKSYNSTTTEVILKQPFSILGDIIGTENTPNLTPEHVWSSLINATTAPGTFFGENIVGAGPYYVSDYTQGSQDLVMLPNTYGSPWGSASNDNQPYFSKIVTELVPSSTSLASLLLAGTVDAASVQPSDVAGLLSNPNIKVEATNATGLWYIEFPSAHYPYNMTDFRQAMAYAIDTPSLVQNALAGYGTVGNYAFIPSGSPGYNTSVPTYAYNVNESEALLQASGLKMGSNGFYNFPNGTAFQPLVYVPAEDTQIVLAGTLVVQNLQAVGIDAQLRSIAGASESSVWYQGSNMYFEFQNFGYPNSELLTDQSFYSYFLSAGPEPGQSAFASAAVGAEYNATVASLESATTPQQVQSYEEQIEGIIADYVPSIPLFYPNIIWAYNTQTVQGWPQTPSSFELPGLVFNLTALATIHPPSLSASTVTSSSTTTSTSSSTSSTISLGPFFGMGVMGVGVVVALLWAASSRYRLKR
jgi:peptide/nickel transport system substrate-binding protein